MVRWFTQSNILINEKNADIGIEMIENTFEYDSIIAMIVSEDGDKINANYIIKSDKISISEDMIHQILSQGNKQWKAGSYVYDIKQLSDNRKFIVMIDTTDDLFSFIRIATFLVLIIIGFLLLLLITVFLSRFVTKPAKDAMQREKQFISDASHELKTPIGAISINAQALRTKDKDNKYIRNILSESQRMNRLIERLLVLSKLDEKEEVQKNTFSLSSCIEETVLTYESVAYDKNIAYNYDISDNISFYANEDDIRRLTAVLIDNAIKHTDSGNTINISLSENSGVIKLSVENTGKGISPDDIPHLFERFYIADASRSDNNFGLGLPIAKAVATRNSGKIYVQSEEGVKTCFTVEFK
ncbi:MAG: HAMP domain-containing histidine kinase [Ruminococcus sp.]|nr:HAMP domain-containing histidine kinase [Ruminococcus sp.]